MSSNESKMEASSQGSSYLPASKDSFKDKMFRKFDLDLIMNDSEPTSQYKAVAKPKTKGKASGKPKVLVKPQPQFNYESIDALIVGNEFNAA